MRENDGDAPDKHAFDANDDENKSSGDEVSIAGATDTSIGHDELNERLNDDGTANTPTGKNCSVNADVDIDELATEYREVWMASDDVTVDEDERKIVDGGVALDIEYVRGKLRQANSTRGAGGGEATGDELRELFDAHTRPTGEIEATIKENEQQRLIEGKWETAATLYDTYTQGNDTPDKSDARDTVVEALEAEAEWMCISDRSQTGKHYELKVYGEDGWDADGTTYLSERMSDALDSKSTTSEVHQIEHQIATRNMVHSSQLDAANLDETLIPFENGVVCIDDVEYDPATGEIDASGVELRDHNPNLLMTYRLPAAWNPNAASAVDAVDGFMADVTNRPTDVRTMWELAGNALLPVEAQQKSFGMIIGGGDNGKTIFFNMVTAALGRDNVSGTPLEKIVSNRFSASRVVDKMANIAPDIGGNAITDISMLKTMTGGDHFEVEPKGLPAFDAQNRAAMLFGANSPPAFTEKTEALKSRLVPVRLPYTFVENPTEEDEKQRTSRDELMGDLTSDDALAAVALRLVEGAVRVTEERGYSLPETQDERMEIYEGEADPIADFRRQCLELDADGPGVASDDIKAAFDRYASENDHPQKDKGTLRKQLDRLHDIDLRKRRPRSWVEDERITVYEGIKFSDDGKGYLPENAFWEKYTGDDDEFEEVAGTSSSRSMLGEIETGRRGVKVEVANVRDEPAPWMDGQGVMKDETGTVRYEIPEDDGYELAEGGTYVIKDVIVTEDDAAEKIQLIAGMSEAILIDSGEREDEQDAVDSDDEADETSDDDQEPAAGGEDATSEEREKEIRNVIEAERVVDSVTGAKVDTVIDRTANHLGIDAETVYDEYRAMLMDGKLMEPKDGRVKLV